MTKQKLEESRNLARVRRKLQRMRFRRQIWGVPTYQEHYKVLRSGDARLFEGDSDDEDDSTANDDDYYKDDDSQSYAYSSNLQVTHSDEEEIAEEVEIQLRDKRNRAYTMRLPTPNDVEPHPLRALNLISRAIGKSPRTAFEEAEQTSRNRRRRSQLEKGLQNQSASKSLSTQSRSKKISKIISPAAINFERARFNFGSCDRFITTESQTPNVEDNVPLRKNIEVRVPPEVD